MIAFGGAAPLHAARLAEKLGIRRVIVPRGAGVGSAVGFLLRAGRLRGRAQPLRAARRQASIRLSSTRCSPRCAPRPRRSVRGRGAGRQADRNARAPTCAIRGQGHEITVEPAGRPLRRRVAAATRRRLRARLRRDLRPDHSGPRRRDHELDAATCRQQPEALPGLSRRRPTSRAARPRNTRAVFDAGRPGHAGRVRSITAPTLRAAAPCPAPPSSPRTRPPPSSRRASPPASIRSAPILLEKVQP